MAQPQVDPLVQAVTDWVKSAPAPIREMIAQKTAEVTTDKKAKADVNYRPSESDAESCSACSNYDGANGCAVVAGHIDPSYVSDEFRSGDGGDGAATKPEPTDQGDNAA